MTVKDWARVIWSSSVKDGKPEDSFRLVWPEEPRLSKPPKKPGDFTEIREECDGFRGNGFNHVEQGDPLCKQLLPVGDVVLDEKL